MHDNNIIRPITLAFIDTDEEITETSFLTIIFDVLRVEEERKDSYEQ